MDQFRFSPNKIKMIKELDNINEKINLYQQDKDILISNLTETMLSIDNERVISKIGFFLIENFKDEKIEQCLLNLIKQPKWKGRNGTFLYLLGEYTNERKYLYFLIDMLMNNINDGEIFMSAYSMIINIHPPFDKEDIRKSLKRLEQEKYKMISDDDIAIISSLYHFLNKQIEIADFYSKFE